MILLLGIPSESPMSLVVDAAEDANIPYLMFNQREAHLADISWGIKNGRLVGLLSYKGEEYPLDSFSGIYIRMMDYQHLPEIKNKVFNYIGEAMAEKSKFVQQQLLEYMEVAGNRMLNKPSAMLSNMSKSYQAQYIGRTGLFTPPTCVTSSRKDLDRFQSQYGNLIYKSVSSTRSIVKSLQSSDNATLQRIQYLPVQFQKELKGANIRVHVVGEQIFPTKIVSEVVDYRYSSRENKSIQMEIVTLPKSIEKACLELSKALELPLCGIDLFLTEEGEYFCFEVNPSPGYSFYQEHTGQNIAGAIVNWLEYGKA